MNPPEKETAKRRSIDLRVLIALGLVILLALGMGVFGFLAGRTTAPMLSATISNSSETVPSLPSIEPPAEIAIDNGQAVADIDNPQIQPTLELQPSFDLELAVTPVAPPEEPTTAPPASPTPEPPVDSALPPGISPLVDADLSTLYEIWELIADQYDGEIPPPQDVIESVISGSLDTLGDDYTRYVPPDIARRMREDMQGSVEGIGAYVRENEDGMFEIVRPIDGQPAALAGLLPGDILIAVDGVSVNGTSFEEIIMMVRGPKDTTVTLTISREGETEPLDFSVTRTRYEVPVVEAEMLPLELTNGRPIAYIRLTEFNRNAEDRLLVALDELLSQQPDGLIFDLRDNPGGFLDQSVAVADAFLPEGVALFERNIRGLDETFTTNDGDLAESIPLVVLVNAGSASASEIVAGAIQDRGRGPLIGEKTFGKGSVQQIYTLSDDSELRVTIARWYTPNNHTIDGEGITPDIEVESPLVLGGEDDTQLLRAIDYLLNGQ